MYLVVAGATEPLILPVKKPLGSFLDGSAVVMELCNEDVYVLSTGSMTSATRRSDPPTSRADAGTGGV